MVSNVSPSTSGPTYPESLGRVYYYGTRYYDPRMGRFISRDPKEELAGLNLYAFVHNNPINKWDYLGMEGNGHDDAGDYGGDDGVIVIDKFVVNGQKTEEGDIVITVNFGGDGTDDDDGGSVGDGDGSAPNNEQQKKECEGLASIIGTFQGEAQKALNQLNSQLAYLQRLQASFSKDNFAFVRDARGFFADFGGDIGFGLGAGVIGGQFAGLGNELLDAYDSAHEGDGLSSAGHIVVGVYVFANEMRPSIYRSRGFEIIAGKVLPAYLVVKIGIKAYEHFGATVYNEWQQARIMEQNNQVTSQLMGNYLQQDNLAKQFQQQYKDKGCDKILGN